MIWRGWGWYALAMILPPSDSTTSPAVVITEPALSARLVLLGEQLGTEPGLSQRCRRLAREAAEIAGLEDCVVYVPRGNLLVQMAAIGNKSANLEDVPNIREPIALPIGIGVAGLAAARRAPMYVADVRKVASYIKDVFPGRSEYAVAIIHAGELVGVLDSESRELDGFGPARRRVMRSVCALAAPVLANQRIPPAAAGAEVLGDLVAEFAGVVAASAEHLDNSMALVAARTAGVLQVSSVAVWLTDGATLRLIDRYEPATDNHDCGVELPAKVLDWYRERGLDQGILIASDRATDQRLAQLDQLFQSASQQASLPALESAIHAPIRCGGELRGMLCVDVHHTQRDWTVDEVVFVSAMANSAALGLIAMQDSQTDAAHIQAQRLDSLDRLAGGVAHNFNNLLTVINGSVGLMLDSAEEASVEQQQLLRMMEQAGAQAQQLTRDLLAFGKRQRLSMAVLDAREMVQQAAGLGSSALGDGTQLILSLPASPCWIECDHEQIARAISSLLINAVDAMPLGGKLRLSVSAADEQVVVRVEDSGAGVPKALERRLFEPFLSTKDGLGTGLGLSVAYGIVQQHRGELRLGAGDSEEYPGAVFEICLPAQGAPVFPAGDIRVSEPNASIRTSERVLLAEDNQSVATLANDMLRRLGYEVIVATTGGEALRLLGDHSVSLLIADLTLADIPGLDLYQMALRGQPDLKALFIAGDSESNLAELPKNQAAVRYLSRPFTLETLESELYALFARESARSSVVVEQLTDER